MTHLSPRDRGRASHCETTTAAAGVEPDAVRPVISSDSVTLPDLPAAGGVIVHIS
jgi:hypothetical protein